MSYSIWKYQLRPTDEQIISMPCGAVLRSVAVQHGEICLWAHVDTEAPKVSRGIAIIGTGHPAPPTYGPGQLTFVGTILLHDGQLVLHVFDAGERP